MNDIGLDQQILANELRRPSVIGQDATYPRRRHNHMLRPLLRKEASYGLRFRQIQFPVSAGHKVMEPCGLKMPEDGRSGKAGVACNINFVVLIHGASKHASLAACTAPHTWTIPVLPSPSLSPVQQS